MEYIRNDLDYRIQEPTVITLGKFDGLHRGHELLMENLFAKSRGLGLKTVVFTFDIPPRQPLGDDSARVLTTNEEKRMIFEQTGVDYLYECPFTPEVMRMEPDAFIRWITDAFCVRCIVAGNDFRFGHRRAGDYRLLEAFADRCGYELLVLEKKREYGRDISSSFVREEIAAGHIEKANHLLGYPFFVQGTVVHGRQIGRTMGLPTVNLEVPQRKLLPKNGVYTSRVRIGEESRFGITNVGCRPTVAKDGGISVETHIPDFEGDLYGRRLTVEFLRFIRPEMKFSSVEELKKQIQSDLKSNYYENITKKG